MVAKRDEGPTRMPARPLRPNPGMTECCGGSVYNAHGLGVCWGPRWVGRIRGYRVAK